MKKGYSEAHGWKLFEIEGEQFRINVDMNQTEFTLSAMNLKTM